MLTIIHGNDYVASRNLFNQEKSKESVIVDAITLAFPLHQLISGSTLFNQKQKVFIENAFNKKAVKNFDEIIDFAKKAVDIDLYLLSDKELSKTQLKDFSKFSEKNFKIPQNIWVFIDQIYPNNSRIVSSFHEVLKTSDADFVFSMIIRQFRLMISLINPSKTNIDEIKRIQPWQEQRIKKQASLFSLGKLKNIYKKLYEIDKAQKTGSGKLNLVQAIDMFLLEI